MCVCVCGEYLCACVSVCVHVCIRCVYVCMCVYVCVCCSCLVIHNTSSTTCTACHTQGTRNRFHNIMDTMELQFFQTRNPMVNLLAGPPNTLHDNEQYVHVNVQGLGEGGYKL